VKIKYDELRLRLPLHQATRQILDGPERQGAGQLVNVAVGMMLVENFLLVRLPVAARGDAANVVFGNDAVSHIAAAIEQVQIEVR
jgi:hypothetical protein